MLCTVHPSSTGGQSPQASGKACFLQTAGRVSSCLSFPRCAWISASPVLSRLPWPTSSPSSPALLLAWWVAVSPPLCLSVSHFAWLEKTSRGWLGRRGCGSGMHNLSILLVQLVRPIYHGTTQYQEAGHKKPSVLHHNLEARGWPRVPPGRSS